MTNMGYFTSQEIREVSKSLNLLEKVGIVIASHSGDEQEATFFDKAKVWRVIKEVIATLYIEKLSSGKLLLTDRDGNEYRVEKASKGLPHPSDYAFESEDEHSLN